MTRTPAPKPQNFDALADAWNDPERFAHELNAYYAQISAEADTTHSTENVALRMPTSYARTRPETAR